MSAPTSGPAPADRATALLDRVFAPVWAGPWDAVRWGFVLSQAWAQVLRWPRLADAYGCQDMVFTNGPWRLADYVILTPASATAAWTLATAGLLAAAYGGKLAKPGLIAYLLGAWTLLAEEAISVRAHDRLAAWVALGLLLAPIGERGLVDKARAPWARWYLILVFSAIYGATGWSKVWHEPAWFDGTALQYHLVHRYFGGYPLSLWVSAHRPLTWVMCWWTVLFECAFPVLIWVRRTNPWVLFLGAGFHVGILALMDVGPFSLVSLATYPALLHPDAAHAAWERIRSAGVAWKPRGSTQAS